MTAQDMTEPPMSYMYFDCGTSTGRYGTDQVPPVFQPIPDGCTEVDEETYNRRTAEIWAQVETAKAAMVAADRQAEDDRISDLVSVKVAEILSARDGA